MTTHRVDRLLAATNRPAKRSATNRPANCDMSMQDRTWSTGASSSVSYAGRSMTAGLNPMASVASGALDDMQFDPPDEYICPITRHIM